MCSNLKTSVSVELDNYILDQDTYYWFVKLSDGTVVYEDDDRPTLEEKSAWKRLKNYCESAKLYIVEFGIRFRSNSITINTADWDGVFFIKSVLGHIRIHDGVGPPPTLRFPSRYYYNIGKVTDNEVCTQMWEVPAILLSEEYTRVNGDTEKNLTIYKNG